MGYTYLCRHIGNAVHGAVPDDVFNVDVITDEPFLVVVDIDDTHQSVAFLSEIVQERGVLTERIVGISRIVARRLIVAEQDNHSFADEFLQGLAPADIGFFTEHVLLHLFYILR